MINQAFLCAFRVDFDGGKFDFVHVAPCTTFDIQFQKLSLVSKPCLFLEKTAMLLFNIFV